jgi:hypothetical protein
MLMRTRSDRVANGLSCYSAAALFFEPGGFLVSEPSFAAFFGRALGFALVGPRSPRLFAQAPERRSRERLSVERKKKGNFL